MAVIDSLPYDCRPFDNDKSLDVQSVSRHVIFVLPCPLFNNGSKH
ncbi:10595_t:CDS:2 [Cetraspora pellucida]|uniref:10595_t:CDS:1 n=1 Tax=Cetraspora pellucida TaxID=1433469 RepID=A0ACA9KHC6_9GLOM|nr:10595_t:CDS:2 [Cetraspora pellucida]